MRRSNAFGPYMCVIVAKISFRSQATSSRAACAIRPAQSRRPT